MRFHRVILPVVCAIFLTPYAIADRPVVDSAIGVQVGPGQPGVVLYDGAMANEDDWEYRENCDGTFENGYAWRYLGVQDPYYGAFAEGFQGPASIQAVRLYLTQIGAYEGQATDIFVWGPGEGGPGSVLQIHPGVVFDAIAYWPDVSVHDVPIHTFVGDEPFYVGSQGDWPLAAAGYYWAVDQDGIGGDPWTCIAPSIGYPTGWSDPDLVWEDTQAMGIGVFLTPLSASVEDSEETPPAEPRTSWGGIKALFAR